MAPHVNYLSQTFSHFNVSLQDGNKKQQQQPLNTANTFFRIYPQFDSCQKRNYLEKYDAVLLEPYTFSAFVRFYRDSVSNGIEMESRNFVPIPLIPYEVYTNRIMSLERSETLTALFHVETLTSCTNQPDVSDAQHIRLLTGYSNFSSQDVSIIEKITSKYPLIGNWTLINTETSSSLLSTLSNNLTIFNLTGSNTDFDSLLLSSSCYMCQTSTCAGENFNPELDYWIIPQFLIIVGYFILVFSFGLFKKPSMRRRIALPYFSPLLILTLLVTFTSLSRMCICVIYNISTLAIIWLVFIYSTTIVRFYYLRNLYSLITKFPNREKLLKILASEKSGFLLTVVLTFGLALIFNMGGIFLFFNESKQTADIFRPAVAISFILIGAFLGFLMVVWDMVVNLKRIRNHGLISFLVFDDPLYVRLDMLSLLLVIIIAVLTVVGQVAMDSTNFSVVSGLFNTILCVALLLTTGGNTVIFELFKKVRAFAKNGGGGGGGSVDELELMLKNEDLYNLLREYSAKEFSSENIEMYSHLLKLKEQRLVSLKDFEEIDDTFMKNYSKYEINFPSSCKREFYKLKEELEKTSHIEYSVLWRIVGTELVMNLLDTFKRLQETPNYKKWESVSKYQKHIHP